MSILLASHTAQTWSVERLLDRMGGVTQSKPHCHELAEWTWDRDSISFWLKAPLTLVSSPLFAPESSETSVALSVLFSTFNFNAITGWGLTRVLHCKEGLMLYTGYITIIVLKIYHSHYKF